MYYELYVDVLFLVNFMMDYILLLIVRRMLKCSATHANVCLGAAIGSLLTCIVVVLPIPYSFIKLILFHLVVNTCMIRAGLKIKTIRHFVKAYMMLYIGSFLLGGIMEIFQPYVKFGGLFLVIAIAGYYTVLGIWKFISYVQRWSQCHCKVELYLGNEKYEINGMIDTGNGLRDPISGLPVSVLDRATAKRLLGEERVENVRYIPYQTIGKQAGVLPVVQIDKMCVYRDTECWTSQPLIGISEEELFAGGEYEMILNPNLF